VVVAWYLAFEVRLLLNRYLPAQITRTQMKLLAPPLAGMIILWAVSSAWRRVYGRRAAASLIAGLVQVIESAVIINASAVVLTFFSRRFGTDLSRSFILLFAAISFVLLIASLFLSILGARLIQLRWHVAKRVAVLGTGMDAREVVEAIGNPGHALSILGLILPESSVAGGVSRPGAARSALSLPVLGTTRELAAVINHQRLDRIIVATDTLTEHEVERCGTVSRRMGITVSHPIRRPASDVLVRHEVENGIHFINLEAAAFTRREEVLKRAVDIILASALLAAAAPLMLLLACLIRLTSQGPVLYCSSRVGKGGRHFTFWKFRSMYVDGPARQELAARNECSGHLFKIRSDPRITPVGRLLRRLSLDELPQLFNVLTGDMSLVGPRPLPIEDLDPDGMSQDFAKWAIERSRVRPGITGLWQVRGRSELPFNKMVELDMEYIHTWSIGRDFSILCQTPRAVFSGRGAY